MHAHCDFRRIIPEVELSEFQDWNFQSIKSPFGMKIATIIARVLLGLVFVVFGSNIFLHFIPMPPPPPGLLGDFTKALFLSHYLHVVAVFQIVGGLLLVLGRFVALGLVLLAPVIVNIDLVHILLDPSGLPMAIVISILLVFLIWRYRDAFKGILSP
jgi:putative oxidoreductase